MSEGDPARGELGTLLETWSARRDDEAHWRASPEPYRRLAARFLKLGAAPLAKEVARTGLEFQIVDKDGSHRPWAGDVHLRLAFGLALARTYSTAQAQQILTDLHDQLGMGGKVPTDPGEMHVWEETLGMLARTYKDQSMRAADRATREMLWQQSLQWYERAYRLTTGYWTGINVATMARLAGDDERASEVARAVRKQCLELPPAPPGSDGHFWVPATIGEAWLVLGDLDRAGEFYRQAGLAAAADYGNINTTRRHAKWLLEHLQEDVRLLDRWLPVPRVVVFSGHMIDTPGRSRERFPSRLAAQVKASIKDWLRRHNALIGYSSAACGADILFQEALRELGGECRVILPCGEAEFVVDSVDIGAGADWKARFEAVIRHATQVVQTSGSRPKTGGAAYDFANQVMHGMAARRAAEMETPLLGLAVWNGETLFAAGGTGSAVAHWRRRGVAFHRIDLSQLPAPGEALEVVLDEFAPDAAPSPFGEGPPLNEAFRSGQSEDPAEPSVAALLFADAVGFSKLPEHEVPLFVREFLGRIARLLDEFDPPRNALAAGSPEHIHAKSGSRESPTWPTALGTTCPVRATWGDGLFLVFPSLQDAGDFALRLITMVRETDWPALGFSHPLSLRVALHAGPVYPGIDPISHLPNAIGSHVSRAARLEPKTPPGEIYASEAYAALTALDGASVFDCIYVKQLEWAKHYGSFPTFVVQRRDV